MLVPWIGLERYGAMHLCVFFEKALAFSRPLFWRTHHLRWSEASCSHMGSDVGEDREKTFSMSTPVSRNKPHAACQTDDLDESKWIESPDIFPKKLCCSCFESMALSWQAMRLLQQRERKPWNGASRLPKRRSRTFDKCWSVGFDGFDGFDLLEGQGWRVDDWSLARLCSSSTINLHMQGLTICLFISQRLVVTTWRGLWKCCLHGDMWLSMKRRGGGVVFASSSEMWFGWIPCGTILSTCRHTILLRHDVAQNISDVEGFSGTSLVVLKAS